MRRQARTSTQGAGHPQRRPLREASLGLARAGHCDPCSHRAPWSAGVWRGPWLSCWRRLVSGCRPQGSAELRALMIPSINDESRSFPGLHDKFMTLFHVRAARPSTSSQGGGPSGGAAGDSPATALGPRVPSGPLQEEPWSPPTGRWACCSLQTHFLYFASLGRCRSSRSGLGLWSEFKSQLCYF